MSIGRHTTYNIIGSVTPIILALVTIPLYLHVVGVERYGALAIIWLILGYFGLFDLGLGRATIQRIAALADSSAEHRAQVFWTALAVNLGIGLFGAGLLYFGALHFFRYYFRAEDWLIAEVLAALPLVSMAVPVATLTGVASGALQGRERFLEVNISTIIGTSLFQLLPLAMAYAYGPTLYWLVLAAVIGRVLGFGVFLFQAYSHILRGFGPVFNAAEWMNLLKFGGWVSVTMIISPFLVVIDRFLIGSTISATAVTVYTVPFEIVQRVSILPRAVAMALFPKMASLSDVDSQKISERASRVILIVISPVIFAGLFFIGPFLTLWVGEDIARQAQSPGIILMLGFWANAFAIIPYSRLQASGRPDLVTKILLSELIPYLLGLYFALKFFGLQGAAIMFALRTFVDYLIMSRVSLGRWQIDRLMIIMAFLLVTAAMVNIYLEPFSGIWWVSGVSGGLLAAMVVATHIPSEFRPFLSRYIPASFMRYLKYS